MLGGSGSPGGTAPGDRGADGAGAGAAAVSTAARMAGSRSKSASAPRPVESAQRRLGERRHLDGFENSLVRQAESAQALDVDGSGRERRGRQTHRIVEEPGTSGLEAPEAAGRQGFDLPSRAAEGSEDAGVDREAVSIAPRRGHRDENLLLALPGERPRLDEDRAEQRRLRLDRARQEALGGEDRGDEPEPLPESEQRWKVRGQLGGREQRHLRETAARMLPPAREPVGAPKPAGLPGHPSAIVTVLRESLVSPVAQSRRAPKAGVLATALRAHWPEYLMEGALLGLFMMSACAFAVLLEHPGSAVHAALPDAFVRRALMGLAMGATAVAIIFSGWGKRSGAHINPATTLTFLRLGKVQAADAPFVCRGPVCRGVRRLSRRRRRLSPACGTRR